MSDDAPSRRRRLQNRPGDLNGPATTTRDISRARAEGKHPIAYTVTLLPSEGVSISRRRSSVSQRRFHPAHGKSLTHGSKGQRRTPDSVQTADEAKEQCEIAYAHGESSGR
jgi:hypothetical protein